MRYVEALRLDAKLGGFERSLTLPPVQHAALAARRRDLVRGVRSILPQIQRQKVDAELTSGPVVREEEPAQTLQMSWENVTTPGLFETAPVEESTTNPQPLSTSLMSASAKADPQESLLEAIHPASVSGPHASLNARRTSTTGTIGEASSSYFPGYLSHTAALPNVADAASMGDASNMSLSLSRSRATKPRSSTHEAFSDPANISMASLQSRSHAGDRSTSLLVPEFVTGPVLSQHETKSNLAWGQGLPADPLPTLSSGAAEPQLSQAPPHLSQSRISLNVEDTPVDPERATSRAPRRSEPMSKLPPPSRTRRARAPRKRETASPDDGEEETCKKAAVPARRFARAAKSRKAAPAAPADLPAQLPMSSPVVAEQREHHAIPGMFPGMMDEDQAEAEPKPAAEVEMREVPQPRRTSPRRHARPPEFEPRTLTGGESSRKQPTRRSKRTA